MRQAMRRQSQVLLRDLGSPVRRGAAAELDVVASQQNPPHVLTRHYPPDRRMLDFVNSVRQAPPGAGKPVQADGAAETGS